MMSTGGELSVFRNEHSESVVAIGLQMPLCRDQLLCAPMVLPCLRCSSSRVRLWCVMRISPLKIKTIGPQCRFLGIQAVLVAMDVDSAECNVRHFDQETMSVERSSRQYC